MFAEDPPERNAHRAPAFGAARLEVLDGLEGHVAANLLI